MVRFAEAGDLERINELRKAVNDVHVHGRPDIFKAGFHTELRDYIYSICKAEDKDILVVEREGVICGYACLRYAEKSETPFMRARHFLDVDEFGVDEGFRRQGVGTELMEGIRVEAGKRGLHRIELNMWEFNKEALAFYESVGFKTYRRYLELEEG